MAKERLRYKSSTIKGFSAGELQLSFADVRQKASMFDNLNKKLDSINDFAVKQLGEQKAQEGMMYGAENAPTVKQFLDANPDEREELLPGDKITTFGKSARNTALSILSNQVLMNSQKLFSDAELNAVKNNLKPDEYMAQLNGIIEGSVEALMEVSPEAAIKLNAQLSTKANTYYLSYSDRAIKEWNIADKAGSVGFITSSIDDVGKLIQGPDTYTDIEGVEQELTIDMKFNLGRQSLEKFMLEKRFKATEMKTYLDKYDKAVLAAKSDFVLSLTNLPEYNNKEYEFYKQVENGTFYGVTKTLNDDFELPMENQKELLMAKQIWENSSETEKTKILTDISSKITQLSNLKNIKENAVNAANKEALLRSEVGFIDAMKKNDLVGAGNFLAIISTLDANKYETYSKSLGYEPGKIGVSTPGLKDTLEKEIFYGRIGADEIFKYVEGKGKDYIDDGQTDYLRLDEALELAKTWTTSQDTDVQTAISIAKAKILKSREPELLSSSQRISDRNDLRLYNQVVAEILTSKLNDKTFNASATIENLIKKTKTNQLNMEFSATMKSLTDLQLTTFPGIVINGSTIDLPTPSKDMTVTDVKNWKSFVLTQKAINNKKKRTLQLPNHPLDYTKVITILTELETLMEQIQ